jgi:hypothetical protein
MLSKLWNFSYRCSEESLKRMPAINKRETTLIRLFLSAYENGAWASDELRVLDEEIDGAIDGFVQRASDGCRLAIEHTLIQPFVDDKRDFAWFEKNFLAIDQDESLVVPERVIQVYVDAKALIFSPASKRAPQAIHEWLRNNTQSLPLGTTQHSCPIGDAAFTSLWVKVSPAPSHGSVFALGRQYQDGTLGLIVENALRKKLKKLAQTDAEHRVLLLERDRLPLDELGILKEIDARRADFAELATIDEIWFAQTMFYERDACVEFNLYDGKKLAVSLTFLRGRLITKCDRGVTTIVERI